MKVFYTRDFRGYFPVGTAAIVIARDLEEAYTLMTSKLIAIGLSDNSDFTLHEVQTTSIQVIVLQDGDY